MFGIVFRHFYPDIKPEEYKKFSLLGIAFFFTVGTYWLLRLLKDVVMYKFAFPVAVGWPMGYGREMIPFVKTISPFVVVAGVAIYSKLVDMFEKHQLFYVIVSTFIAMFSVFSGIFFLASTFGPEFVGKWPLAIAGVTTYLSTELFGSLVLAALFWSFTTSSNTSDQAKRGFPFIIMLGQVGAIIGSSLLLVKGLPLWPLYLVSVCTMAGIMATIYRLVATVPAAELSSGTVEKKSKPDIAAGLKLLLTKPYLMGVFVVSTFYEVAKVIVDYQMKSQASIIDGMDFNWFIGVFGVCTNTLSFVMALLGTAMLMKRYGLRVCLLLYPVVFGLSLIGLYFYFQSGPDPVNLLWVTFAVMMLVTAASYAVNNPTKEMMYIPTSKDAKFKAKGLVDMVGGRGAKMTGARIGGALNVAGQPALSIVNLMTFGTLISLGFIGAWMLVAMYVGIKNAQLVRDKKIIE